jgi:hypothetical protein
MTLFVNTWTILLCHMNPINITMETYVQVMQNMLKVNNYLWIDIRVLEWTYKKKHLLWNLYANITMVVKN